MQWTVGIRSAKWSFFYAQAVYRFDGESTPAPPPLTQTVGPQEEEPMIDYLTYYYKCGTEPFRSLSALPDEEAIRIMEELCDDTPFGVRFKGPVQYMRNRRQTEQWVREEFILRFNLIAAIYNLELHAKS